MGNALIRGIFDLGFSEDPIRGKQLPQERPLNLGQSKPLTWKQTLWDVLAWLLLSLGMFFRQGLVVPDFAWMPDHLSLGAFLASVVLSLAIYPSFMRWFNRHRPRVGLEHVALPFSFGFFLDIVRASTYKFFMDIF
jgi:hypothetical protein